MITNIRIRNFKTLEDAEFKLGADPVVLIGPNSCGKTSILQALTMWRLGVEEWCQRYTWRERTGKKGPRAVGIPLKEFSALAIPDTRMIWHDKKIIGVGDKKSERVRMAVDVSGTTEGRHWNIAVEFVYQGRHILYCSPLADKVDPEESPKEIARRWAASLPQVAFLQPMSGMSEEEDELKPGSIDDRLGKGKTADVLRNICYQLVHPDGISDKNRVKQRTKYWAEVKSVIAEKFFVQLGDPKPGPRGKIILSYRESDKEYDLSCGGRGFHQTLLLLAYLYSNPNSIVLLDEPDAHLEIKRQRSNFALYTKAAESIGSQLIIASHSEVVMNEATERGNIVQVIGGKAENVGNREQRDRLRKWLSQNDWSLFYLSQQDGYIAFLEGETDKLILPVFAEKIFGKRSAELIRQANIAPVGGNDTGRVKNLFRSLRELLPDIRGYALFDNDIPTSRLRSNELHMDQWGRREVENYILIPDTLYRFAKAEDDDNARRQLESMDSNAPVLPLPPTPSKTSCMEFMREAVADIIPQLPLKDRQRSYWRKTKMSSIIEDIMERFSELHGGAGAWSKWKCHTLIQYMEPDEIPDEVREKITRLLAVIDPDFNPEESQ